MNLKKLITESASKEAMGIAAFTATRGDAVQKFIDDNGIDASALYKYVKNGKMPERMAFVSALVGNPGNKMFKMLVSKFGMSESINQNQINLLKATYGDIKKINPNSPAAKKLMMALKKLSKDDLETLSKAKINFVSTMAQSILRDSNVPESIQEGKKRFNTKYGVGKSKYVVSYHDGVKKHKDGSDFFDIQIFKNQKDLDTFKKALLQKGFIEESVNEAIAVGKMVKVVDNPHWEASLGKKGPFKRKVKMIDGDNVFFTDGSNSSMKYVKEDTQLTNEADLNWNAVQNAIINFLKVNTKILDKKVQAKDTEGVKGGLKSIISGLTNAQRSLNLESVNEASYTVKAENPYQFVNGAYAVLSAYLRDEELGPKGKRELQSILKSLDYMRKYFYSNMNESVNEAVSFKDGKYHFYSKNEVAYLTYGGKEISSGDWDVDADAYFMNHSSWKGQKAFDDGKDVIRYFKKNNIITESSKDDILKDLDKAKTDLLKKVEVLITKKKKLYSNVDITTPMSADEKKLDKDIADLFSQINTLVLQKRDINRKSVNEAKKSTFTKVAHISNNGKLDIY